MVAADDEVALAGMPMLSRAISFWHDGIARRRPFCPACRGNYADDAHPGAFLFSVPALAPTSASVTAFCDKCWRDLPTDVIEREAVKVLRRLLPHGHFLDARRR